MRTRSRILQTAALIAIAFPLFNTAQAHHSFSPYDLENPIEITGTLTEFQFRNPHVTLKVETEDGAETVTWHIESMNVRRWDAAGVRRDAAKVGDVVTLKGWPAHDGGPSMVLSTISTEAEGTTVVRSEIRQGHRQNSRNRTNRGTGRR